jgi:hypothetical protein
VDDDVAAAVLQQLQQVDIFTRWSIDCAGPASHSPSQFSAREPSGAAIENPDRRPC